MLQYKNCFKKISSCVDDLNDIYGFSVLLNFFHDFTIVTTELFVIMVSWMMNKGDKGAISILILSETLENVLKISSICFACHITKNAVR